MKQYKVYRYCIEEAPEGMSEESVYDLVAEQLATMGFDTFIQESGLLMAYISAEICTLPEKGVWEIAFPPLRCAYTSELLPEGHYNAVWEESEAKPVTVGNQLYIRAPHHAHSPNRNLLEILIAPKDTFGTASHPTTHMMLEMILKSDLRGKRGIDVGCGTGLLGITALLRGAEEMHFIDTDERAIRNTQENLLLNNLPANNLHLGTLSESGLSDRDFLLVNIHRNIILSDLPLYHTTLRHKGILLLSGFFEEEDAATIRQAALEQEFTPLYEMQKEGWAALGFYCR